MHLLGTERPRQDWSRWTDTIHAQVNTRIKLNDPSWSKVRLFVTIARQLSESEQYAGGKACLIGGNPCKIDVLKEQQLLSYRLKLKFSCMMELSNFPLDTQVSDMVKNVVFLIFNHRIKSLLKRWFDFKKFAHNPSHLFAHNPNQSLILHTQFKWIWHYPFLGVYKIK